AYSVDWTPIPPDLLREFSTQCALLDADQRSDGKLGKKFPRGVTRQADAAVRSGIIRHVSFVHSKIEAVQSHEVRHLDLVDRGNVITVLVGDDIIPRPGGEAAAAPGRTDGIKDRHAILDHGDLLRGKRN